jgi:amino acid permease
MRGYPYVVALVLSMLLFAMSTSRLSKGAKFMPMGLIAALSLIMSMRYVSARPGLLNAKRACARRERLHCISHDQGSAEVISAFSSPLRATLNSRQTRN